jgi:hypothetical protein
MPQGASLGRETRKSRASPGSRGKVSISQGVKTIFVLIFNNLLPD